MREIQAVSCDNASSGADKMDRSSAQEQLTVVDASDRAMGVAPRTLVHRAGMRHRSVHILVFDPRGRLLLQRRSHGKDENPGLWDSSAAGHVEAGETYGTCARRELAEELGIRPRRPLERLFKIPASAETGWEFCMVYRVVHCGSIRPDPREIMQVQWLACSRVTSWVSSRSTDLAPSFRFIWRRFLTLEHAP